MLYRKLLLFCCQWLENVIGVYGLMAILILTAIIYLTYLSKETISIVRTVLNPVGALTRKVKFGINNLPENNEQPAEEIKTLDDPEVFDDPETQTVIFDDTTPTETVKDEPAEEAPEGKGDDGIIINDTNVENKADSTDVSGQKDLSTPIDPHEPWTKYKYPTLDLLKKYDDDGKPYIDMKEQTANKNRIVEVLKNQEP